VASELGLESAPFTGPRPKENLQFWPCAISKWLNIDMNMLLCSEDFGNTFVCDFGWVVVSATMQG